MLQLVKPIRVRVLGLVLVLGYCSLRSRAKVSKYSNIQVEKGRIPLTLTLIEVLKLRRQEWSHSARQV